MALSKACHRVLLLATAFRSDSDCRPDGLRYRCWSDRRGRGNFRLNVNDPEDRAILASGKAMRVSLVIGSDGRVQSALVTGLPVSVPISGTSGPRINRGRLHMPERATLRASSPGR
jgi:hypothetical protein